MDEIIYLEPDEEITSVIDKIKNASSNKLGLVVPRDAVLLQSVINLRLLSKEAINLKKDIAVVTNDKIGRNLAAQVGLSVYNSIEEQKPVYQAPPPKIETDEVLEIDMAPKVEEEKSIPGIKVHNYQDKSVVWKKRERPVFHSEKEVSNVTSEIVNSKQPLVHSSLKKDLTSYKKIIWPVAGILTVLILIACYLLIPKVQATVTVPSEDLIKSLPIVVSSQIKQTNVDQSVLPGTLVEVNDSKKEKFVTTGKKNIGEKSKGTITFYNNLDSNAHALDAGTKLSNSSKTFVLNNAITIPGAGVSGGSVVPGTVKAEIQAESPGEDYNVKAGRFTILGLSAAQQDGIYGQSQNALTGGMSKEVQVLSQEDYDKAKAKIIDELSKTTQKELEVKTKDQKILDKALVVPDPEITTTANVDQEASDFEMEIKYKKQVLIFNQEDLNKLLITILEKQVPADKNVAIAKGEDVTLVVDKTAYDKGEMNLTANVIAKIATKVDEEKIKKAILGKKIQDAESYIQNQPGVTQVELTFKPKWWLKKVPDLERNVNVQIYYQTETK